MVYSFRLQYTRPLNANRNWNCHLILKIVSNRSVQRWIWQENFEKKKNSLKKLRKWHTDHRVRFRSKREWRWILVNHKSERFHNKNNNKNIHNFHTRSTVITTITFEVSKQLNQCLFTFHGSLFSYDLHISVRIAWFHFGCYAVCSLQIHRTHVQSTNFGMLNKNETVKWRRFVCSFFV